MKWCFINNLYSNYARGGAEVVLARIIEQVKQTDEVVIITLTPEIYEKLQSPTFSVFKVNPQFIYHYTEAALQPTWKKIIWHWQNLFSRQLNSEIKEILQREKPDIVWTHNLSGLGLQIPKLIRKFKLRHWHTLHDYQLIDPYGTLQRGTSLLDPQKWNFQIYAWLTRRLIKNPEVVMSPSQFCLDIHQALGFFKKSKKLALPNPIILPEVVNRATDHGPRFLFAGQLAEHKGIKVLLTAWSKISNQVAELWLAGDGELLGYCQEQSKIDPRIKVLGKLDSLELSSYYQKVDCLVVPSIWWDNSPTVIYEASSFNLPSIASRVGGIPELVQDKVTGFLVEPGNVDDLVVAMNSALKDLEFLTVMGNQAKKFISQFSLPKFIEKINNLAHEPKSKI